MPAEITPRKIEIMEFFNGISKSDAAPAPVQAPVPGRGIATNKNNPSVSYFKIDSLFFLRRCSNLSIALTKRAFFSQLKIFLIKSNMNGIGSKFPITQIGKAILKSTFKNLAANKPPRNSRRGVIDIKKIINSEPKLVFNFSTNSLIKDSKNITPNYK